MEVESPKERKAYTRGWCRGYIAGAQEHKKAYDAGAKLALERIHQLETALHHRSRQMTETKFLIVYPATLGDGYDPIFHRQLQEQVGAHGVRMGMDWRDPANIQQSKLHTSQGSTLVPILDFDYQNPRANQTAAHAVSLIHALQNYDIHCPFMEIGNEPYTLHRMPALEYAKVVRSVVDNTDYPMAIAGDFLRPGMWLHSSWLNWWRRVVDYLVMWNVWDRIHSVAIHPYKQYNPALTRIHWPSKAHQWKWLRKFHSDKTRSFYESETLKELCGGKPYTNTEFGWDGLGISQTQQAKWVLSEFEFSKIEGLQTVALYHHGSVLDVRTRQPTILGQAIKEYFA